MKTQNVRLIDVFLLGPAMILAASQKGVISEPVRLIVFVGGVATILYNWKNYQDAKRLEAGSQS